jgi:hypothetical protein
MSRIATIHARHVTVARAGQSRVPEIVQQVVQPIV